MSTEKIIDNISNELKEKYNIDTVILAKGKDACMAQTNMKADDVVILIALYLGSLLKNKNIDETDINSIFIIATKGIDYYIENFYKNSNKLKNVCEDENGKL